MTDGGQGNPALMNSAQGAGTVTGRGSYVPIPLVESLARDSGAAGGFRGLPTDDAPPANRRPSSYPSNEGRLAGGAPSMPSGWKPSLRRIAVPPSADGRPCRPSWSCLPSSRSPDRHPGWLVAASSTERPSRTGRARRARRSFGAPGSMAMRTDWSTPPGTCARSIASKRTRGRAYRSSTSASRGTWRAARSRSTLHPWRRFAVAVPFRSSTGTRGTSGRATSGDSASSPSRRSSTARTMRTSGNGRPAPRRGAIRSSSGSTTR